MFCPRCGAPREEGARFCPACGADLSGAGAPKPPPQSWRSRLERIVGTNRKSRVLTLATVAALIVAVIAFIALKPDESSDEAAAIPRDAYTLGAEHICIQAKRDIAASERASVAEGSSAKPGAFAQALVPIVIRWRTELGGMRAPSDRVELAESLDTALREVEVEISALARVAQEGDRAETVARAKQVDEVSSRVEAAVAALGLSRCARLRLGVAPAASG